MSLGLPRPDTLLNTICETLKENQAFFQNNKVGKKLHRQLVDLVNDVIDYQAVVNDLSSTKSQLVLNGLMPYSYGLYLSALSGNIATCFMQLRLMVEYLALSILAEKLPGDNMLEKLSKTRERYEKKRLSTMIQDFDSNAFGLWKSLSKWFHANTYSKRIEDIIIEEGVKTWSIIQPAPYDKDDERHLDEILKCVKTFRSILKKAMSL